MIRRAIELGLYAAAGFGLGIGFQSNWQNELGISIFVVLVGIYLICQIVFGFVLPIFDQER